MNEAILDRLDAVHAWLWRWRWPIRLVVAAVLIAWFGRFAHVRMTTPPADPGLLAQMMSNVPATQPAPDVPVGRLLAAINRIPVAPALPAPTTAPAGMQWQPTGSATPTAGVSFATVDPLAALSGTWTPQERYHLQQIILYLEDPRLTAALEEIREIAQGPLKLPSDSFRMSVFSLIRQASKILCARARYYMAEKHDFDAASRDIETILQLARRTEDGPLINYLVSVACRCLALGEVAVWSREFDLTRPQARQFASRIQEISADPVARWRNTVEGEAAFSLHVLDAVFTKDADGDGWLVLHTRQSSDLSERAMSILNLLSPLVNDRCTIQSKIAYTVDRARRAVDLPYMEAIRMLGERQGPSRQGAFESNPADGPASLVSVDIGNTLQGVYPNGYLQDLVYQRTAQVAVALSAYKTERSCYPDDLAKLVPDYLEAVPLDPFTGKPMPYRLDERDGYSLYSVGADGSDDGGRLRDATGRLLSSGESMDRVSSGARDEPDVEWFLVPAGQVTNGNASQPSEPTE